MDTPEALDVLLLGGSELSPQVPQRPSLPAFRLGVAGKLMPVGGSSGSAHFTGGASPPSAESQLRVIARPDVACRLSAAATAPL